MKSTHDEWKKEVCLALVIAFDFVAGLALAENPQVVPVADGWARTSVNAVIFRNSSVTTLGETQYVAFYDPDQNVVLGKRKLGSKTWEIRKTSFKGNCKDAHNSISIGVDGGGLTNATVTGQSITVPVLLLLESAA